MNWDGEPFLYLQLRHKNNNPLLRLAAFPLTLKFGLFAHV